MSNEDRTGPSPVGKVLPLTSHARKEVPCQPLGSSPDAYIAHAALILKGRSEHQSVNRAVEYLYEVADVIGVDRVELAGLIVLSSERRARTGHGATA